MEQRNREEEKKRMKEENKEKNILRFINFILFYSF